MSAHQDGNCLIVYLVYHCIEQVYRLQLVNQQRVFLFVAGILYGVFQVIQFAQVLFPCFIDDMQQDRLLKRFHYFLAFAFISGFQVAGDVIHALAVCNGNQDVFVHVSLILVYLLDNRISDLCHTFGFAFEKFHGSIESLIGKFLLFLVAELLFRERSFHGKCLEKIHLAVFIGRSFDRIDTTVPNHVHNVHTDTFAHQSVAAFGVDYGTLFVHHIVVFQQAFTDTEVVFFHFLLCTFNRL